MVDPNGSLATTHIKDDDLLTEKNRIEGHSTLGILE
jgi:hypothetical protein